MNQSNSRIIFLLLALLSAPAMAVNKGVEINIGGIGPAVDAAAFRMVKRVVGNAVANGVIDQFNVSGYGIEGGFSACAQATPFTSATAFGTFVQQLRAIKPNRATTTYSLRLVASCTQPVVFCTQDVKQCPDGSWVGRVAPSCAFAPCPGK